MTSAICLPYIAVSSTVIFLHRRVLDVLSLGDDEAASLGINVARARLTIVVAATLGTAAAVSVSGLIAFVGIIVPHMIRLLVSTSYRALIPLSLLGGAGFLVLADVLARTVVAPASGTDRRDHGVPRRAVLRARPAHVEVDAVIAVDDLWVRFGPVAAVRGVSFATESGGWTALIGPNGAGKTSALRALAGLVRFDGDVRVEEQDVRRLGRRALARLVAFVPQKPETPPELTVAEYVLLGRTPHISYLGGEGKRDRDAAARALRRLDLAEFAQRSLGSLSGGELQRTVLARALAQEARVLLLDEPTTSLDLGRQQLVLELVDELRQDGLTVVTTLHDLTLAGQYAEHVVLLDGGAVVAEGAAADVLSAPNVAAHYGANVRVIEDESGVFVVPVRR